MIGQPIVPFPFGLSLLNSKLKGEHGMLVDYVHIKK